MGILNWFSNSNTLYFPGCYSFAFARGKIGNYEKILKKFGINFKTADENVCCSGILTELGYDKESRKLARENFEILKEKEVEKIIVSCPLCYYTFSELYKNMLPDWNIRVEYLLETILNQFKATKIPFHYFSEEIVYYDSCYMARYSKIFNVPREILKMLGFKVHELDIPTEEQLCCGSCGGLLETNPELAEKIAMAFIKSLKRKGIRKVVTADIRALRHLKKALYKIKEDIEIIDISDIVCDALTIRKNKEDWE